MLYQGWRGIGHSFNLGNSKHLSHKELLFQYIIYLRLRKLGMLLRPFVACPTCNWSSVQSSASQETTTVAHACHSSTWRWQQGGQKCQATLASARLAWDARYSVSKEGGEALLRMTEGEPWKLYRCYSKGTSNILNWVQRKVNNE